MSTGLNDMVKVPQTAKEQHALDITIQAYLPKAMYDRLRDDSPKRFDDHTFRWDYTKPKIPCLKPAEQLGATVPDEMVGNWNKQQYNTMALMKQKISKLYTKKKNEVPMKGSQGASRPV